MNEHKTLTNYAGIPVGDNQNSLTAGPQGPVLLQDYHLIEKLAQFNRERVPERVVHAKGSGAHGYFVVTADITAYTKAKLFSRIGKRTPVFTRFSTVAGERGFADTDRDPRGFAVKFYTEEGNWDMVGNNTPVFFIRDPLKFPDFIHSQKRDPKTNMRNATSQWDFWSLSPEALHQITILFSDRGIPDGYRHMNGYSSHTFSLINEGGERFWCKWHFKTKQGIRNLSVKHAVTLAGEDPEYAQRDLYGAIEKGDFPRWRVCVQIMKEADAARFPFNPFDLTKIWPHADYPLMEVGEMVLDRNPENYFAEVEQSAFEPSNVVPGMGFSPDKMLQGRLFAYADAHRYRIGTNYGQLPINQPKCPFANYHRDGAMRFGDNGGATTNYEPNSFNGPLEDASVREPALAIQGKASSHDHRADNDDYTQAGDLFRLIGKDAQQRLATNIVAAIRGVAREIQVRQIMHFHRADPEYGSEVAVRLGMDIDKVLMRKRA